MLFNSFVFIFLFLPLSVIGFYICRKYNFRLAMGLLTLLSLFYYSYWKVEYLPLILGSILANHFMAKAMLEKSLKPLHRKMILYVALSFNILLLGYFKYTGFLIENLNAAGLTDLQVPHIVLPLALSFFTFQKIAYQVDIYKGRVQRHNLLEFFLFVSFFPQLIAGPIVHHSEMMPQFIRQRTARFYWGNISVGLTIFAFGLFKKVVIADGLSRYVSPVYAQAAAGNPVDFYAGWVAALGYTLQLYFDFSGYSDMAIGCARMFGIRLPCNFFSPYRAGNIIDFWRRWHMTLSRFLRDYVYIPMGGNRKGKRRQMTNLFMTMFIGGIWHGAGWTYVVWGALHGVYLIINHIWRDRVSPSFSASTIYRSASWLLTFTLVVITWVFFRADSLPAAGSILGGMLGVTGLTLPVQLFNYKLIPAGVAESLNLQPSAASIWAALYIAGGMGVALFLPNTYQLMSRFRPSVLPRHMRGKVPKAFLHWRPDAVWALMVLGLLLIALSLTFSGTSEFLYYDF